MGRSEVRHTFNINASSDKISITFVKHWGKQGQPQSGLNKRSHEVEPDFLELIKTLTMYVELHLLKVWVNCSA